ncbi:MAG TPA: hypothetical protein DDZ53_07235, partial [Firmicutes bacterium]|nr:hypothetical protein [Bacillota bacterium]
TEKSAQVLHKQQLWLDTVLPTASTTVTWDDGESGYAPVDYSGGSEFEFYFPLTVTDQPGPGSDYASLTNGVQGYFVWQDNTPGNTEAFPFEYYVTGSQEQPTGAYKVGRTGQKLGFEQLDTGNFLHIRLSPDVEYNIGSSALVFHPTDNAGNEGNVSFPLVYQMDRMGPRINRVSYLNSYAGVDQGQISTTICLEDFNPILSVEYQWTDVGADPIENGWAVDSGAAERCRLVTIVKGNLKSDENHSYLLHVRGTDSLGNVSTAAWQFDYNLQYPKYGVLYGTNPNDLLSEHSFKVFLPDRGIKVSDDGSYEYPAENVANSLLVLLKKPTKHPGVYDYWGFQGRYYKQDLSDGSYGLCGQDRALEVLLNPTVDLDRWFHACLADTEEGTRISSMTMNDADRAELRTSLANAYGPVEVTIFATPYGTRPYDIPVSVPHARDTYVFNFASTANACVVHGINIQPKTPVSYDPDYQAGEVLAELPTERQLPASLDGAVVTVSLSNLLAPVYGLADIDCTSADTYFSLLHTSEGGTSTECYRSSLIAKAEQDIAIPAGTTEAKGTYSILVQVKCKGSDHIDCFSYEDIMIDQRELDIYGVTEVRTRAEFVVESLVSTGEAVTQYPIAPGSRTTEVFVSAADGIEQTIGFSAQVPELTLGTATTYGTYIKVWNESTIDSVPLDQYRWVKLEGTRIYETVLLGADNSQLFARLGSPNAATAACLPLVTGLNEIRYQIATTSGRVTPIESVLVRAGSEQPVIRMKLFPDNTVLATSSDVIASIKTLESSLAAPETLQLGVSTAEGFSPDLS